MPNAADDSDARWGSRQHPYTFTQLGRTERPPGEWSKQTARLDRASLMREGAATRLPLERIIPVVPFSSDPWPVVLRRPAAPA